MAKYKYIAEFEINAAPKMLYPYLSTPVGLKEWFAEDVHVIDDKHMDIVWDGTVHRARIISWRLNQHIKYKFITADETQEGSTLEFRIEFSDMTQTSFLKIIDYSDMDDDEQLGKLWDNLMEVLRECLGAA
jgi:uncharacterized protein YndB with AHSA1/START domain